MTNMKPGSCKALFKPCPSCHTRLSVYLSRYKSKDMFSIRCANCNIETGPHFIEDVGVAFLQICVKRGC